MFSVASVVKTMCVCVYVCMCMHVVQIEFVSWPSAYTTLAWAAWSPGRKYQLCVMMWHFGP